MNNEKFQEEKNREIEKLEKQIQLINKIKQENHKINLFEFEKIEKINSIFDKNQKYLHKLKSNEFEIAIVGLEKAGKSTFANALIQADILPSAPERCTFTSTKLMYSPENKAEITFYKTEEFNEIFKSMLRDLEYPNVEEINFLYMTEEEFNNYFNELKEKNKNLYTAHIGKTNEEIIDILKNKNEINQLLDSPPKIFSDTQLQSKDFREYITGQKFKTGKTLDGKEEEQVNSSKPRSVKSLKIFSSNLNALQTAIIYDVPGFDSPTKIHERQTLERLKKADAIILVTNVEDKPNLNDSQLSIITENADEDGISLKDKLFIFGNKIDKCNDEEIAKYNRMILLSDVLKYKIAIEERVYIGSAKKYLIEKNLYTDNKYKCTINISDNIDEIRQGITNYYENERFEILKRKIDSNKRELKEIFQKVADEFETDFDSNFAENEKNRIILETNKNINSILEKNLKELKYELKKEILDEKYFSKKFKEDVQSLNYFQNITEEEIEKAKIDEDESLTLDIPIEKMNQAIRKQLHIKFLKDFSFLIKSMTDEKSKDVELRILRAFTSAIVNQKSGAIFDSIEKESEKIIKKLTSDIAHDEGRFTYLIERFSRDIFDILISYPLYSEDRKNKFKESSVEFEYLDKYYQGSNGNLIKMILVGEKNTQLESVLTLSNKILSWSTNNYNITNKIEDIKNASKQISNILSNNTSFDIDEILKDKERSKTEEEVLEEINKDIENLRDILINAVTSAINLEAAFLNSIDKQIKVLINAINAPTNNKNSKIFNDFISKIIPKIKFNELNNINQKLENYKLQREIIEEMKEFEF